MRHRNYIIFMFAMTLVLGILCCFLFFKDKDSLALIAAVFTAVFFFRTGQLISRFFRDVDNFAEAARYRDFSKQYPERTGWRSNNFYRYFNEISRVFLSLNKEKEVQQQYLKKMLELIDTGILAYDKDSLDILWMNNAFQNIFLVPSIKNVRWLETRQPLLFEEINNVSLGQNRLFTANIKNQTIKTLVNAHVFQTDGKTYKMIAFHNIGATMEEVEANAWKGLLSVMTHEIMNSIAPVASLAGTLKTRLEFLRKEKPLDVTSDFEDIELALDTIHRRSEGLLRFSENYRSLSKTIIPDIKSVDIADMLNAIYQLMQPSLLQKEIDFQVSIEHPKLTAVIDRNLIEQVLINFITNATYAVKDKEFPQIIIYAGLTKDNQVYITVADNGKGIADDVRDKIFIPFFSTKKHGTGIGLSLSREIIKLHHGRLQVQSRLGEGTAFTILLRTD